MAALLMTGLAVMFGFGIFAIVEALRGQPFVRTPEPGEGSGSSVVSWWGVACGVASAGLVWWATGWIAPTIVCLIAGFRVPGMIKDHRTRIRDVERAEALASWVENMADNIAADASINEAIRTTAPLAPEVISPAVSRLVIRLQRGQASAAFEAFGEEVQHPAADLAVIAMNNDLVASNAAVGAMLSRLAVTIRSEIARANRIDVSRSKAKQSGRIILGVAGAIMFMGVVFGVGVVEAFQDTVGQIVLAVVIGLWAGGWAWATVLARMPEPERFRIRRDYDRSLYEFSGRASS